MVLKNDIFWIHQFSNYVLSLLSLGLQWFRTKNKICINICNYPGPIYLRCYEKIEFSRSRTLMNILWSNWDFFCCIYPIAVCFVTSSNFNHLLRKVRKRNAIFTFVICWNFPRIPHSLYNWLVHLKSYFLDGPQF